MKTSISVLLFSVACQKEPVCDEDSGGCDSGTPQVDTASLTLPEATQERWEWSISGDASIVFAEGRDSSWTGQSRWAFRDVDSGEMVCEALLETSAKGEDFHCEEDSRCDWAFFVAYVMNSTLQGDCENTVGLVEGGIGANWALGYSSSWEEGPRLIAYVTSEVEGESPEWTAMGDAQFDGSALSYEFDPVGFFVFRD